MQLQMMLILTEYHFRQSASTLKRDNGLLYEASSLEFATMVEGEAQEPYRTTLILAEPIQSAMELLPVTLPGICVFVPGCRTSVAIAT